MSQLLSDETKFDPDQQYYFLDYQDKVHTAWIRAPYMTLEEIQDFIAYHLPFFYDNEQRKCVPMFERLRITPMSILEELHSNWNPETEEWEEDTITNAQKQFDGRYDGYGYIDGTPESLTKKSDETTEDWKVRVQKRKDEIQQKRLKKSGEHRKFRDKVLEECSNERVAKLIGWRHRVAELNEFRNKYLSELS